MSLAQSLPAQRVPAWKRLGLKLKGADDSSSLLPSSQPVVGTAASPSSNSGSSYGANNNNNNKRKDYPARNNNTGENSFNKRSRIDLDQPVQDRRKSVTFTDDTKGSEVDPSAAKTPSKPKKIKKIKIPKAKKPPVQDFKPTQIQPELSKYLREWNSARETWKFKKNYQTLLIKYAFTPEMVPAADFGIFLRYSSDSKGASRDWLIKSAEDLAKKDVGAAGFPEGTKDAAEKQEKYEALLGKMLHSYPSSGTNANGKRVRDIYSEEDFVMGGTGTGDSRDPEVTQRLVKRLRAELVLEELSGGEDLGSSTKTTTTTGTTGASESAPPTTAVAGDAGAKDARRKRNRNKRTLADDDSSSSSDSSDDEDADDADEDDDNSSSGTSSSGSDDSGSESEGTLLRLQQQREELDTSSESSSSSDSDSNNSSDEGES